MIGYGLQAVSGVQPYYWGSPSTSSLGLNTLEVHGKVGSFVGGVRGFHWYARLLHSIIQTSYNSI